MLRWEVARVFGVPAPIIRRYPRLRRQTGDVEPKPVSRLPARKGAVLCAALRAEHPFRILVRRGLASGSLVGFNGF